MKLKETEETLSEVQEIHSLRIVCIVVTKDNQGSY